MKMNANSREFVPAPILIRCSLAPWQRRWLDEQKGFWTGLVPAQLRSKPVATAAGCAGDTSA